jgi:hypothetical protein
LPPLRNDLMETPALATELRLAGLQSMGDIEIRRIATKRMLAPLMASIPVPANSDFEPFVDLNAPRMRFLDRDALDLVRLAMLPIPFADIFGSPLSTMPSDSPVSARHYTRHGLAIEAKGIVRAVTSRDVALAPADARVALDLLLADAGCEDAAAKRAWLDAAHALSSRTTPYLPVAERATLWQVLGAQSCLKALTPEESAWLALLEAAGRGDTAAMAAKGEQLFVGNLPDLRGAQLVEALITTATAQVAVGLYSDASGLLRAYLPGMRDPGSYALALRLAISQAGSNRGN